MPTNIVLEEEENTMDMTAIVAIIAWMIVSIVEARKTTRITTRAQ